ncbi:MAG: hypothetical protein IPJ65_20445 [Archangiaceae bacterium]|nr:hypothetical protein [Archangiaceae bacterium]
MQRNRQRRGLWALGASLALHALLALYLWLHVDSRVAVEHRSQPIVLDIVELEPPAPPAPAPEPKQVAPPQPATSPRPAVPKKREQVAAADESPRAEPAKPGASGNPEATPSAASGPRAPDAPRSTSLVPSSEFVVASGNGVEAEAPRGHTVVNSPEEQPDPVAMREYNQEKLGRRTGSMVEGMVADARARRGVVDPYFNGARRAMESDLSSGDVPLPKEHSVPREMLKGLLQNQANYGRTGNPFSPGTEPKWDDLSLARGESQGMAMQGRDSNWGGSMRQAEQSMAAQQATMQMADHALVDAIIELVQEPGGGISDAHIVKSSGYAKFDEYVLHRVRKVFLGLEDPPETGLGISSAGWRSLWRFSYYPVSIAEMRGQRVRVELLRVEKGQGSGNPLEHVAP